MAQVSIKLAFLKTALIFHSLAVTIPAYGLSGLSPSCFNQVFPADSLEHPVACHLFETNSNQLFFSEKLDFSTTVNNESDFTNPVGFEAGCLLSHTNEKWILFQVKEGADLTFSLQTTHNEDIDAAIWGPVHADSLDHLCQALKKFPISCEYSSSLPELTVNQSITDYFYIILISNSSNLKTNVHLNQPTGGKVEYAYLCPDNIILNDPLEARNGYSSGSFSEILSDEVITPGTKIEAHSGNSVILLPGFSTGENVVFEANIRTCNLVGKPYIDSTHTPPAPCEDFSNHGSQTPHLYANTYSNELVGTVFFRNQPEYSPDFIHWYKLEKMGADETSERYLWAYRYPFDRDALVYLRTRAGCREYPDVRLSRPHGYLGEEDTPLPFLAPVDSFMNINSPFFLSTNINTRQNDYDVFTVYLKPNLRNLGYRINGGSWRYNVENVAIWEEYNKRYVDVTRINGFTAPKDFIIDFTQDAGRTIDRYIVTRNSAGGHFSVTSTFTRVADSSVIVNTFQGDIHVPMQLGNVSSYPYFGNCFFMGSLATGNYVYPLTSSKGDYVLDEHLLLRVRQP